jgi:hypothetical protein
VSSAFPIQVRGQHQAGRARIRHVELRRRGGEIGDPIRTLAALGRSGESLASFRKRLPATLSTPDLRIACEHPRKAEVVEAIAERLRRGGSRIFRKSTAYACGKARGWRTRCEAEDPEHLPKIVEKMVDLLADEGPTLPGS